MSIDRCSFFLFREMNEESLSKREGERKQKFIFFSLFLFPLSLQPDCAHRLAGTFSPSPKHTRRGKHHHQHHGAAFRRPEQSRQQRSCRYCCFAQRKHRREQHRRRRRRPRSLDAGRPRPPPRRLERPPARPRRHGGPLGLAAAREGGRRDQGRSSREAERREWCLDLGGGDAPIESFFEFERSSSSRSCSSS